MQQVRRNSLRNMDVASTRRPSLSAAQRALTRWALVDDHQAILDVHCDSGALLSHYQASYRIRACALTEGQESAQEVMQQVDGVEVMQGTAYDIPWRDHTFHRVMMTHPPEGALDIRELFFEIRRVMRTDGELHIAVSLFPFNLVEDIACEDWQGLFRISHWKHLLKLLTDCGFSDCSLRLSGLRYASVTARLAG